MEQICKNCKYYYHENIDNGYVCVNNQSEHIADWVEKNDSCEYFTEADSE